jgi:hypothetical protein
MNYPHDIFISYTHLDNKPILQGQSGWIDDFHYSLSARVSQIVGRELDIWRDPKLSGNDDFPAAIEDALPKSAVLVSVLSPRYLKSGWCPKEFTEFLKVASGPGSVDLGYKTRIFKVVKTPFSEADTREGVQDPERTRRVVQEIQNLLGYDFFRTDPASGDFHEIIADMKLDYLAHIDDLAQDIATVLKRMLGAAAAPAKAAVYVAETSFDLAEQRNEVRRDLARRGYTVLPSQPLPLAAEELNKFAAMELEQAAISVHMIGARYGVVPDGSNSSEIEMQLALAEQRGAKGDFVRLVWMPAGLGSDSLKIADPRQQQFVTRLRSDSGWGKNADLLENGIEDLKAAIDDRLRAIESAAKKPAITIEFSIETASGLVYLICDQQDQAAAKPLRTYLFNRGFEVTLPLFEGNEGDIRSDHEATLSACDAVIIYYGAAGELFVRKKLRDLQKSAADRKQPMRAKAICIAPPMTDSKRAFLTHDALVIQQPNGFEESAWTAFLAAMKGEGISKGQGN